MDYVTSRRRWMHHSSSSPSHADNHPPCIKRTNKRRTRNVRKVCFADEKGYRLTVTLDDSSTTTTNTKNQPILDGVQFFYNEDRLFYHDENERISTTPTTGGCFQYPCLQNKSHTEEKCGSLQTSCFEPKRNNNDFEHHIAKWKSIVNQNNVKKKERRPNKTLTTTITPCSDEQNEHEVLSLFTSYRHWKRDSSSRDFFVCPIKTTRSNDKRKKEQRTNSRDDFQAFSECIPPLMGSILSCGDCAGSIY